MFLCALFGGSMFLFANYGGEMHSQMAGVFYGWVLSFVLSVFVGFLVTNNVKLLATAALIHWIKQVRHPPGYTVAVSSVGMLGDG